MQRRNQAQRRRDQAQRQRDQAKKKSSSAEQPEDQPPSAQPQENRVQLQEDQAQDAPNQQGQAQQEEVPPFQLSDKIDKLSSALQDLKDFDLISAEEAQEMKKVHAYSRSTAQPQCLTSILERLQAYISNGGIPSRQRRLVRHAKEVLQYHADMQYRYRAHQEADRAQAATPQAQQAQATQQQPQQAREAQQQPQRARAVQEQPRQAQAAQQQPHPSTTALKQNRAPQEAQAARQQQAREIPEPSRSIIASMYRQSELSEQQFEEFRSSLSTEAASRWTACLERSGQLLPLVYQGSWQAAQEIEDMAPILLQPLHHIERTGRGSQDGQPPSAQASTTQAARQQAYAAQPAGGLADPQQSRRDCQQQSIHAQLQEGKGGLSERQSAYFSACSDSLELLTALLRSIDVISQREASQMRPPPPDVVAWLELLEKLERKVQAFEQRDVQRITKQRIAKARGTFQTLRSWIFELPQGQPQPPQGQLPVRPRPPGSAATSSLEPRAMVPPRQQLTTQGDMPGPEEAVQLRMLLEGLQGLDLISDAQEIPIPQGLSVWRETIEVVGDTLDACQRDGRIRTAKQYQKILRLRELLSALERRVSP